MTCSGAGRALLAAAAIACIAAGCSEGPGDYTTAGNPVMNRDTTWTAVGITFTHTRQVALLALRTKYAFEIHTYDVAHRKGPRRIVRWVGDGHESPWIVGWDDSGLIVARGPRNAGDPVRVDPVSGVSRPMASVPAKSLDELSQSLNWRDRHRTYVFDGNEGFFLWNPRTRQSEFLFPWPTEPGEPQDAFRAEMAVRERYADTLHRIWEVSARQASDSTRFRIETYVPRPGWGSRLYVLSLNIERPDTSRNADHFFDDRTNPLAAREVLLGAAATTLEFPVSNRRLQASLFAYRTWMHLRPSSKSVWARVVIKLRPVPLPEDAARLPYAYRDSSSEDVDVSIAVPRDWIPPGPW